MAELNPLRRRMIEDMKVRNLSPVTTLLRACSGEIRPILQPFARSVGAGGGADLSNSPRIERHVVGRIQCRGLRSTLLLRRNSRALRRLRIFGQRDKLRLTGPKRGVISGRKEEAG